MDAPPVKKFDQPAHLAEARKKVKKRGVHRDGQTPPSIPEMLRMEAAILRGELRRLTKKVPQKWKNVDVLPGLNAEEREWIHKIFHATYGLWMKLEKIRRPKRAAVETDDAPELSPDEAARLSRLTSGRGNGGSQ